jgi:predicted DsbA family dithiol-disulfide isomerase
MKTLEIEVWSDIACPWCWVGKRGLDAALKEFDAPVTVRWRAFELNPQAPLGNSEPVDYAQRLADKYQSSRDEAQQMIDRIVSTGRERGLDLRFDRIRPTNTFDAHRLLAWAHGSGHQTALKEAIFKAYLNEGLLVSDHEVLADLAGQVGLNSEQAKEILASDAYRAEVRQDESLAQQIGINGVPCFVFPQARSGISGAQPTDVLLEAMQKAQAQNASLSRQN